MDAQSSKRGQNALVVRRNFRYCGCLSAVEVAVKKVKKLSARQARELLGWLDAQQANGKSFTRPRRKSPQSTLARRKQQFKEWRDSVRGTTNWEPPRMPDDLVKPFRL